MLDGDSTKKTFSNIKYKFSVPEIRHTPRRGYIGKPNGFNQGAVFSGISYAPNTYYDKGLFDTREVGYIY